MTSWAAGVARIIGVWEVGGRWEDQVLVLSQAQSTKVIRVPGGTCSLVQTGRAKPVSRPVVEEPLSEPVGLDLVLGRGPSLPAPDDVKGALQVLR